MSRDQRRRLLRQLRDSAFVVNGGGSDLDLTIGPPARSYRTGWTARERGLLEEWNRRREAILRAARPGLRPWALWWFDVAHAETIPGEIRDRNLATGQLTQAEADMMTQAHTAEAFGRLAASRPGETLADWLGDPRLIESTVAMLSWNPLSEPTIAYLRATSARPIRVPSPLP